MDHDKRLLMGRMMYLAAQALVAVADFIQHDPKELRK